MKLHVILLTAAILCTSTNAMCIKKPRLKNTRWTTEYKEFVADVGYADVTVTLDFVSAKEYEMKTVINMPPHSSMYMNPDGTVDKYPGSTSEYTEKGTYIADKEAVTLTGEKGGSKILVFLSDKQLAADMNYRHLELTREGKLK